MWQNLMNGPQLELDDIQGDIVVGLQKDFEWFLFFIIDNAAKFREFARQNLLSKLSSAGRALQQERELQPHKAAGHTDKLPIAGLNIGFTGSGLRKLEILGASEINDQAFIQGLASRSPSLLNDPKEGPHSAGQW